MILMCSSMMTGNHDNDQLPVVMVGRGGGQSRQAAFSITRVTESEDVQPVPVTAGQGRHAPR